MLSGRIFLSRVVKAGRMSQTDMSERRRLIDWKAHRLCRLVPGKIHISVNTLCFYMIAHFSALLCSYFSDIFYHSNWMLPICQHQHSW